MNHHRLASLVFNRPHYITREAGLAIASVIMRGGPGANRFVGEEEFERDANGRLITNEWGTPKPKGYRMAGATAIVNVIGELVNRGAWLNARSGLVSYEGLATQLRAAASDPRAKRLLLDVNSPGGEAAGMTDIAALVRAIAAEKPVVAIANSMMCSAAYGLCAGATRIVTTELGVVGSIGVVMMHADYSGALDKAGIDVTLIHEGAHKVDGNPFEALPDDVRADFQAECAKYYLAFVDCVAAGRAGLSADDIRATEARTYLGAEAVDVGLADAVGTFEDVLDELERGAAGLAAPAPTRSRTRTSTAHEDNMTLKAKTKTAKAAAAAEADDADEIEAEAAAPAPVAKSYAQADLDAAVASATAAGKRDGAQAERARIKGIVGHPAADGRAELAAHLAYDTDLEPAAAVAMLEKAPKSTAAKPAAPAAAAETAMGLELAAPAAPAKSSAKPIDARSVYDRRRNA